MLERAFTLCENAKIEATDLQLGSSNLEETHATAAPAVTSDKSADTDSPQATASLPTALAPGQSLEEFLEEIERKLIVNALEATRWNKTAAAKELGITFRALRYRLKKLDLE